MISKHSFFGAAIGTLIEYYDYALFGIFLPLLSPVFFAAETHYASLIQGYVVLLLAMIARPLGAIFFGIIGDHISRRNALMYSIYGIAIASLLIGFIPGYAIIGWCAPALLLFFKCVQAFCFGGEYNGAGIYVVEHARGKNEATWGSLLTATTLLGSLIATLLGTLLTMSIMPAGSWRIAFIAGGLFACFGIVYRRHMLESPEFKLDYQVFK